MHTKLHTKLHEIARFIVEIYESLICISFIAQSLHGYCTVIARNYMSSLYNFLILIQILNILQIHKILLIFKKYYIYKLSKCIIAYELVFILCKDFSVFFKNVDCFFISQHKLCVNFSHSRKRFCKFH